MKTAHLYHVTGKIFSEHYYLGEQGFETLPRKGEKIVYAFDDVNMVYEVIEVIHSYVPDIAGDEHLYLKSVKPYEEFLNSPL